MCDTSVSKPRLHWKKTPQLPAGGGDSHLSPSAAIVHHVELGCHVVGLVQLGGIKVHLLNDGDPLGDKNCSKTLTLVLVLPVQEELLEQGGLGPFWQHLDLLEQQQLISALTKLQVCMLLVEQPVD